MGGFLGARFERVKGLLSKVGRAWNELDILTEDGQIKPEIIHQFTSLVKSIAANLQIAVEGKIELAAGVDVYEDMIGRDRIPKKMMCLCGIVYQVVQLMKQNWY